MGDRVAHLITSRLIDFIEFDDGYAIAKTRAPKEAIGRSLAEVGLRTKFGVTVVAIKEPGSDFTPAGPDTVVPENCVLIVAGPTDRVYKFANAT